jgi:hypothetical protein
MFRKWPHEPAPAYNLEKMFHPKGNGNGYVLTFGGKRAFILVLFPMQASAIGDFAGSWISAA